MKLRSATLLAAGLALMVSATTASAQVSTVFSTGNSASHVKQAIGSVDSHYQAWTYSVLGVPLVNLGNAVSVNTWAVPLYNSANPRPNSGWIWDTVDGNLFPSTRHNQLMFRTSFDLTGYSGVNLFVQMTADNAIDDVFLNGVSLGQTSNNWGVNTSFTLNSALNGGVNTLDFYAREYDNGSPSALNVQILTEGSTTSTPEPASMVLLGTGLLGIGAVARRRRSAK